MLDKLKIDRKLLRQMDFSVILILVLIAIFGCINIYSATHMKYGYHYLQTQLFWLLLGLVAVYLILLIDYATIKSYIDIFYWIFVVLLFVVLFTTPVNGATGWLGYKGFTFQPSEFAKLAMIVMVAKKIDSFEGNINNIKNFMIASFYVIVPVALILKEPDMGMTMVCFFIVLGIYFMAGLNLRVILGGLSSVIMLVALVWNTSIMEGYWKGRIISFLNPDQDSLGTGLQLRASQIGIGSGGIFGSGFLAGTQTKGGFIPENYNDFIFSVVGEEWGLIGAAILILLYGILLFKFIKIARSSKDVFGSMICVGVISTFLFTIFQNIGMTIGIMPITGLTLPFMSYGGSSMLTAFVGVGFILNVGMRKNKINF